MKKIAMLTGGGDCPGLNAVIRAVTRKALLEGYEVFGFRNGWAGVLKGDYFPLTRERVSGILHLGGTILGTSRTNPTDEQLDTLVKHLRSIDLAALVAIGGDDTLSVASRLHKRGTPVIGVPKTIDNDIDGTDQTFGFDTAINIATEAIDRLHSTAESHSRVLVVELMGRQAGWIALEAGMAGGADLVLLPEFPMSLADICKIIKQRQAGGKSFSIVAVAEGFKLEGMEVTSSKELDSFGHVRLGGIGETLCREIEKITGIEIRAVVLGYIQRGRHTQRLRPRARDALRREGGRTRDERQVWPNGGVARPGRSSACTIDSVIVEATDQKTGKTKLRVRNRRVPKELYERCKGLFRLMSTARLRGAGCTGSSTRHISRTATPALWRANLVAGGVDILQVRVKEGSHAERVEIGLEGGRRRVPHQVPVITQ